MNTCNILWFNDQKRIIYISKVIDNSLNNDKIRSNDPVHSTKSVEIWFRTPYCGEKGLNLIKSCIKKLKRYMKNERNVYFNVMYDTVKLSYFTNSKDKILSSYTFFPALVVITLM